MIFQKFCIKNGTNESCEKYRRCDFDPCVNDIVEYYYREIQKECGNMYSCYEGFEDKNFLKKINGLENYRFKQLLSTQIIKSKKFSSRPGPRNVEDKMKKIEKIINEKNLQQMEIFFEKNNVTRVKFNYHRELIEFTTIF